MRVIAHVKSNKDVIWPEREHCGPVTIKFFEENGELVLTGSFGFLTFFRLVTSRMDQGLRHLETLMRQADKFSVGPEEILWEDLLHRT